MIEYNVSKMVFSGMTPDKAIGATSFKSIRGGGTDWGGYGANFAGAASVIYQDDDSVGIVTHLHTAHSFRKHDSKQLEEIIAPQLNWGKSRPRVSEFETEQDGVVYKVVFQYIESDGSPIELWLNGSHSVIIHGVFPKPHDHKRFQEYVGKYQAFVSNYYDSTKSDENPDKVELKFTRAPGKSMPGGFMELLLSYQHRENGFHYQYGDRHNFHIGLASVRGMSLGEMPNKDDVNIDTITWRGYGLNWKDIYCLGAQKEQVRGSIETFLDPDAFRTVGITKPETFTKVLLVGNEGMGKSMIGEAVVTECRERIGEDFIALYITQGMIASKYKGQTGRNVRLIFDYIKAEAQKGKHIIVYWEHINSIGIRRYAENIDPNEALDEFNTGLTECHKWGPVMFMGATAQPRGLLDREMTRHGRFGITVEFPTGDLSDRLDYINKRVEQLHTDATKKRIYRSDFDAATLAAHTEGLPFAELDNVLMVPVHRNMVASKLNNSRYRLVGMDQLLIQAEIRRTEVVERAKIETSRLGKVL